MLALILVEGVSQVVGDDGRHQSRGRTPGGGVAAGGRRRPDPGSMRHVPASCFELAIELRVQSDPGLPRVLADRQGILQILSNLLANAIKFNPRGGTITLSAQLAGRDVEISVADTGVGMPATSLPYVFDRY